MLPADVTAVIVTRGDVDLTRIQETLEGFRQVIVWDNSELADLDYGVFGRYLGCALATTQFVYVQDDDCLIDAEKLVSLAYGHHDEIVANMPESRWPDYPDSTMVGWGAVFNRDLSWHAFAKYAAANRRVDDSSFYRCCDVVFSALTPRVVRDIGFEHLPWAEGPDRMFKQPGHKPERDAVLEACRTIRGGPIYDRRIK